MPVYNMEQFLDQSIGSWAAQTLRDIEIICVDDASTDKSWEVLGKWAQKDERVKIHRFAQNGSAFMARKVGVGMARGEYIMFADADDEIAPQACEELCAEMQREPVDILQFGSDIVNINNLPQARIDSMLRFLAPYEGSLQGKEVFEACFVEHKYNFSLWNKFYTREVCQKAFDAMEDAVLPKAQDKLTYFAISWFAQSYRGLPDKQYYNYFFGRGNTGFNVLTLKQFRRYCTMAWVADNIRDFLAAQGALEQYALLEKESRNQLLNDCMSRWINEVRSEEKAEAFDIMMEHWSAADVVPMLAQKKYYDRAAVAQWVRGAKALQYDRHGVKTIATYYHSIVNGGAQRVVCSLCELWVNMGCRVVLLTDEEPSENDYVLPNGVERVVLPDYKQIRAENYEERYLALEDVIRKYQVDLVVYHAWVSNLMLWDMFSIKLNGAAMLSHCHSVFSFGLLNNWESYQNVVAPYPLLDGVLTLSKADEAFWMHYNSNVFSTINPFTGSIDQWRPSAGIASHDILWCARISEEKNPLDALCIMERVREAVPDARLHVVGDAKTPGEMERFIAGIEERGLQDAIVLHGFQKDVAPYYEKAGIFLMTSAYEGYALALQESKLAGIPCVMYELPYLTLTRNRRGLVPVAQRNTAAAANAIIELLLDEEKRRQLGRDARAEVEELLGFDFEKLWKDVLFSVTQEHAPAVSQDERVMMETLLYHRDVSMKKSADTIRQLKKELEEERARSRRSGARRVRTKFGQSRYARLIRRGVESLKSDGVLATAKRAARKIYRRLLRRG